ncbi:hypothetical protein N9U65_01500 [Planctomycetaceae bacterium]|nr:hypothetical protein [Planctomycetaceae bacterium]
MTQRLFDSRPILTNILTKYKYKTYWRNLGRLTLLTNQALTSLTDDEQELLAELLKKMG